MKEAEDEEGGSLDASATRVVRNIRKKLQAFHTRSYIMNGLVRIEQCPDGNFTLNSPFLQEFVNALKEAVPARSRQWDSRTKVWTIHDVYLDIVENLTRKFFDLENQRDSLGLIQQDLSAGKLVVVDFSGIPSESDRDLIATLITRRLFEYNLERIDLEEGPEGRIPFVAFVEEAQNLLGTDKVREDKNSIFIRTFKEGRALSIGTTSVTQQPSAISKSLTSQIAYYIVQHLRSRNDIRDLVAMDPAIEGTESDIMRRVPGNALYVDNERGFPLPIRIDKFDQAFVEAVCAAYSKLLSDVQEEEGQLGN